MNRRGFVVGLAAMVSAPAIVRASSLMQIQGTKMLTLDDYVRRIMIPQYEALIARMNMDYMMREYCAAVAIPSYAMRAA